MYCNMCGTENPEGSKFCKECGANLAVGLRKESGRRDDTLDQVVAGFTALVTFPLAWIGSVALIVWIALLVEELLPGLALILTGLACTSGPIVGVPAALLVYWIVRQGLANGVLTRMGVFAGLALAGGPPLWWAMQGNELGWGVVVAGVVAGMVTSLVVSHMLRPGHQPQKRGESEFVSYYPKDQYYYAPFRERRLSNPKTYYLCIYDVAGQCAKCKRDVCLRHMEDGECPLCLLGNQGRPDPSSSQTYGQKAAAELSSLIEDGLRHKVFIESTKVPAQRERELDRAWVPGAISPHDSTPEQAEFTLQQVIRKLQESPDPATRMDAVRALSSRFYLCYDRTTPVLIQALKQDPSPEVRLEIAEELNQRKDSMRWGPEVSRVLEGEGVSWKGT